MRKFTQMCFGLEYRSSRRSFFTAGLLFLHIVLFASLRAQDGLSDLRISVIRVSDKVPISGVFISVLREGAYMTGDTTDVNGIIRFATLTPGDYSVIASRPDYYTDTVSVSLILGINPTLPIFLVQLSDVKRDSVIDVNWKVKKRPPGCLLCPDIPPLSPEEILKRSGSPLDMLYKSNPGITKTSGGLPSVKGSRTDASKSFVDGAQDNGSGLNTLGTQMVGASLGGIPANKGDFTGGAFDWITKSAGMKTVAAFETVSSTLLDPFGLNSVAGLLSGPLWIQKFKDQGGHTQKLMKLGYVLNGQWTRTADASPSVTGAYRIREEKLNEIRNEPLVITPNGFVYAASLLNASDFDHVKRHPNAVSQSGNFYGKLEFRPNRRMQVTALAKYNASQGMSPSASVLNFGANPRNDYQALMTYLQIVHNFKTHPGSPVQSAYYTFRADYYSQHSGSRDAQHLDRIFDYGYLGKFETYRTEVFQHQGDNNPNSEPRNMVDQYGNVVRLRNYWEQTNWQDTLVTFTASSANTVRAAYTQSVYNHLKERNITIQNTNQILNSLGLLNGYNPGQIYSLWAAPGTMTSGFSKASTDRYSVFAQLQLNYLNPKHAGDKSFAHDFQFGFFAEQQVQRNYSLDANALWVLMPQLMNRHLTQLDKAHPILTYDANGVFTDTVRYQRFMNAGEQTHFDRVFRDKLMSQGARDVNGKLIDERSMVDINSFAPSDFSLNMFSADELLNNGNNYVRYAGFDYLGRKIHGSHAPSDFLDDPAKRTINPFMPVYLAAWLQDQFRFRDLVFRFGLRMERYDANQNVLADQWSLFPVKTAGEVKLLNGQQVTHPANIGNEFKVYVNDLHAPTKIVGYRNGQHWFNADGTEQISPDFIASQSSNGRITPLLENPDQQNINTATFRDFHPVANLLPRLWFSFPLQPRRKILYVSYDVLAQRPNPTASFLSIDEVYYLKNRQGSVISNGQLLPRVKTQYEVGYKNYFGRKYNLGFELSASYSEVRKDWGLYQVSQAYPVTYITYRNIDFSTITAFNTSFTANNLNEGPLSLYAGYMLMFADGTGSNINSQAALIASNQPNLRTVIPLGELDVRHTLKATATWDFQGGYDFIKRRSLYKGPIIRGREILRFTSINLTFNMYSGSPYTPTTRPVQIGATDRAQVKGVPFGARMPWQRILDLNIARNLNLGKNSKHQVQIFFAVQNLLNAKNIASVFAFTGLPDDDGFLNSSQGQLAVKNQLNSQSYIDYYKMMLGSQSSFYNAPRTVRMGARLFLQ